MESFTEICFLNETFFWRLKDEKYEIFIDITACENFLDFFFSEAAGSI